MPQYTESERGWIGKQIWADLLFAHWPADYASLREKIPEEFEIDQFDDEPWVGVVPFMMRGVRFRGTPAVPGVSNFLELNLRTYIRYRGRPAVYFFSLDANHRLAVWAARKYFHLPYYRAKMESHSDTFGTHYRSQRYASSGKQTLLDCSYRGEDKIATSSGDLTEWLTERYCFFTKTHTGNIFRGRIHHRKWPLQHASAEFRNNTIAAAQGVKLKDVSPILHYSKSLEVKVWKLQKM